MGIFQLREMTPDILRLANLTSAVRRIPHVWTIGREGSVAGLGGNHSSNILIKCDDRYWCSNDRWKSLINNY